MYAADGVDPGRRAFLALPKQRRSSWKLSKAKIKRYMRSPDEWAGSTAEHMHACMHARFVIGTTSSMYIYYVLANSFTLMVDTTLSRNIRNALALI